MRRALLFFAGIIALTYFEYFYYPGHSYLAGTSQVTVAALERLDQPGLLSRDLAATNPNLTYTIYDEVTLLLHRATGRSIESILQWQQIAGRGAALLGVALLCLAAGTGALAAVAITAVINLGALLPGIELSTVDREPTLFAFGLSFTILALGLLANRKPLLASLVAGIALAYQPFIAAVFWLLIISGLILDRTLRPMYRATLPALIIFALLLANASQLQPGFSESQPILGQMSAEWAHLQRLRVPQLWVSTWPGLTFLFYLAVSGIGVCAWLSLRKTASLASHILFFPVAIGILSLPVSLLLVEGLRWSFAGEAQVMQSLTLTVICSLVLMTISALRAGKQGRWSSAGLWIIPVLAVLIAFRQRGPTTGEGARLSEIKAIALWARDNTWGASLFLFPDAGRSPEAGAFRGYSTRAVYVDWQSRDLIRVFPEFAHEWDRRWRDTGEGEYSLPVLKKLLVIPSDYIVLSRVHRLPGVKAELTTDSFVIYDAHLLQAALSH